MGIGGGRRVFYCVLCMGIPEVDGMEGREGWLRSGKEAYICRAKHPFTLGAELDCDSRESWLGGLDHCYRENERCMTWRFDSRPHGSFHGMFG